MGKKLAFDFTGQFDDVCCSGKAMMDLARAMGFDPVNTPPCVAPAGSVVEVTGDSVHTGHGVSLKGIQCVVSAVLSDGRFALNYPEVLKGPHCVGEVHARASQFRVVRPATIE